MRRCVPTPLRERKGIAMLRTFSAVCVAIALVSVGCDSKPTHESLIKETIAKMKEMVAVMKDVKDEPSAKAANPKLQALTKELDALHAQAEKMPKPPEAEEKQLQAKYEPELEKVTGELMAEMMRVGFDEKLAPHLKDVMQSSKP